MRDRVLKIFWGIAFILGGGLLLAQNLGYIVEFTESVWIYVTAGLSLGFFVSYLISGIKDWGWLFPASILAGISITLWLIESGIDGAVLGVPITASIALPFLVAFVIDVRANWWAPIPAFVLGSVTLVTLLVSRVGGELIGSFILFAMGLPFLAAFLTNTQERKWALIPGYVFLVLGIGPYISDYLDGEAIATLVMLAVGLPFFIAFLLDRSRVWAILVAFILTAVGLVPLIAAVPGQSELIGSYVLFAIALPFWAAFILSPRSWWAVIPAGILTSLSLMVYLTSRWNFGDLSFALLNGFLSLGIALTFFVVWLRRGSSQVDWAKYPALFFLVAGLFAIGAGLDFVIYWPFLLIAAGALVLLLALKPKPA
ncbi:MAG TPA: hypothetical protein VJ768_05530 [Anaerolineales bacterium]|nr:hypothetical protein [Anaerolineales bacterium]